MIIKEQTEFFLPTGDDIRDLLKSDSLNPNDLKVTLSKRGIYINSNDKKNLIPKIASLILSPEEFLALVEKIKIKEENLKFSHSQSSTDSKLNLNQAMPGELKEIIYNGIYDESDSSRIIGCNVKFSEQGNPNHTVVEVEIETIDPTRNYLSQKIIQPAKLEIIKKGDKVEYNCESTTQPTKEFINKLIDVIDNKLRENNFLNKKIENQKILANQFHTEEERFIFLLEVIKEFTNNSLLKFKEITSLDIGVNSSNSNLPKELDMIKKNINTLSLEGEKLDTSVITKKENLKFFIVGELEAKFSFEIDNLIGDCNIKFGFPKYYEKIGNKTEYEQKVIDYKIFNPNYSITKNELKRKILKEFQNISVKVFEEFLDVGKIIFQNIDREGQMEFTFIM